MRTLAGWLVFAWRFEVALYRSLVRWATRRPAVPAGATAVPYVGAVSLLLWVFTIGSAVELVALHLILPWEHVRLVADIVGIWGLVWMLGYTASHYVYPHLLDATGLRLRSGHHLAVDVPWDAVGASDQPGAQHGGVPHAAVRRRRALGRDREPDQRRAAPHAADRGAGEGHPPVGDRGAVLRRRPPRRRAAREPRGQCAKWRVPVRYIVTPAA